MFKKILFLVLFLFIVIFSFAKYGGVADKEKFTNDSIKQFKTEEPNRSAQKFSYLNTSQRLSNTIYIDERVTPLQLSVKDSAIEMFSRIVSNNAWLNTITNNITVDLPFGITRTVGNQNTVYQLGFTNISFTKEGAIARAFARVVPNGGGNGDLYFEGRVNLSRIGGVGQDNTLNLIGNHNISFDANAFTLNINGGSGTNTTTFHFNCDGFTKLNLNASVELNASSYFAANSSTFDQLSNEKIRSNVFQVQLEQWEKIFIENVSFPTLIGYSRLPNYFFRINKATIDFSTLRNTDNNSFSSYFRSLSAAQQNIWMGFNITDMDILLPSFFSPVTSNTRATIKADYAVIDENGFSFYAKSRDAISDIHSQAGSANGWPLGISKFDLMYIKDAVVQQSSFFKGRIVLPIEDRVYSDRGIPFMARFRASSDNTSINDFDVEAESVEFIIAKNFRGVIHPEDDGINIDFIVKNNKIFPTVTLSGKFGIQGSRNDEYQVNEIAKKAKDEKNKDAGVTSKEINIQQIEFQDMVLQTEVVPFLKVDYAGGAMSAEVGGFGAQVSVEFRNTGVTSDNRPDPNAVCIRIDAAVQLAEGKFGGAIGINLYCKYDQATRTFEFDALRLGSLNIKADIGPNNSIDGSIDILDGPEYGQGFSGQVVLRVANTVTLKAGVMFGNKAKASGGRFHYFNVDGSADFRPLGVVIFGVIKITGFSGGFTYKMDPVPQSAKYPPTITGVSYVPNENSFLRLRAGVFFSLANDQVFSGWGGMEFVFNNNWGLNEVSISGKAQLFSQPYNEDKNKISPLMEARQQTYMTYKANQGEVAGEESGSFGKEIVTENGTKIRLNKRSSLNYLQDNSETKTRFNPLQEIALEDTISVIARMRSVKSQIDSAKADSASVKAKVDSFTIHKNMAEAIMGEMQRRSDSISDGRNSIFARDFYFFNGTDLSKINNFYFNSYRHNYPEEWQQICSLLNIPLIPNDYLKTRRSTYTLPTQARINTIKNSLRRDILFNPETNARVTLRDTFQRRLDYFNNLNSAPDRPSRPPGSRNLNNPVFTQKWGYRLENTQPISATKQFNDSVTAYWIEINRTLRDSISKYTNLRDSLNRFVHQANPSIQPVTPILLILGDSINVPNVGWRPNYIFTTNRGLINGINPNGTRFTLLNEATINYNFYVNILVPKFKVEDSIADYLKNVVQPLRDSLRKSTALLNLTISKLRALEKTYFDTLEVVNNYNLTALAAQRLSVRLQARQTAPTSEESAILSNAKTAFAKAAPIINSWIITNKRNQANAAVVNLTSITSSIAEQRAIINSTTASTSQKNAAQATLNNLMVQYRIDSARVVNNTLSANGGPIFSYPGKLEMHHISKYVPTSLRNTDVLYATVGRLESNLVILNRTALFRALTIEEARRKQIIEDSLKNETKRAVYVIAFNLLNTPEKASVDLFNYRSTAINFEPIAKSIDTAQAWLDRAIAFIEDSIQTSSRNFTQVQTPNGTLNLPSSLVRQPRPEGNPRFWGDFVLKVDFKNGSVSLGMNVYLSVEEKGIEVIKGSMDDSRKAGTLDLLFTKSSFRLFIGKEEAPCSVDITFNRFMTGKGTFFLYTNNQIQNTNGNVSNFRLTFGVEGVVNRRADIDLVVVSAYAYLEGRAKLSATVSRYTNLICVGKTSGQDDFNGWYGQGTFEASIKGVAGVTIAGRSIDIITGQIGLKINLRGPSPLYFRTDVDFRYDVLGYRGSASVGIEYGEICNF